MYVKAAVSGAIREQYGMKSANRWASWGFILKPLISGKVARRSHIGWKYSLKRFVLAENQIGSIFINAQGILGLEMLGSPVLFSQVCDKVTRSFAFEVLGAPDLNGASSEAATQWWDTVLKSGFTRQFHQAPERIFESGLKT